MAWAFLVLSVQVWALAFLVLSVQVWALAFLVLFEDWVPPSALALVPPVWAPPLKVLGTRPEVALWEVQRGFWS